MLVPRDGGQVFVMGAPTDTRAWLRCVAQRSAVELWTEIDSASPFLALSRSRHHHVSLYSGLVPSGRDLRSGKWVRL